MKLFWILAAGIAAQDEGSGEDTPADMLNTPGLVSQGGFGEIDEFDISQLGRSTGGGAFDFANLAAGGRALPPGVSMIDFVDASGNFNSDAFREALMAAYAAEQEPATPAPTQPPAQPARPARPGAEEANKYFFQTTQAPPPPPTTAPPPPPENRWCWKCDAMDYTTCATYGKWQYCELGDKDCCFVEVRQSHRKLQQLCTGCKAKRACEDNKKQNFRFPMQNYPSPLWDQCRPDYRLQSNRRFRQQSVCRQCFNTCDKDLFGGKYCFGGGMVQDGDWDKGIANSEGGTKFQIPYSDNMWRPYYKGANLNGGMADVMAYGIPTWLRINGEGGGATGIDSDLQSIIEDWPDHEQDQEYVSNMYWGQHCDENNDCTTNHGKVHPMENNVFGTRKLSDMTYWALEGASRYWWMADLKYYQDSYVFKTFDGCDQGGNAGEVLSNCPNPITINNLIDIYNARPKYPIWG